MDENVGSKPAPTPRLPRFFKWINDTGVAAVAKGVGVSRMSVYQWRRYAGNLSDEVRRPDPTRLQALLKMAAGRLSSADIYPEDTSK